MKKGEVPTTKVTGYPAVVTGTRVSAERATKLAEETPEARRNKAGNFPLPPPFHRR